MLKKSESSAENKIGQALQLQQVNILEIEHLRDEVEELKVMTPEIIKQSLERLLVHAAKTSKLLQELTQSMLKVSAI